MNHPLPKSLKSSAQPEAGYEFVKADAAGVETEEVSTPMPALRRLRDQVNVKPDMDDPYEAYRQRILQAQADRVEHARRTMPPLPPQSLPGEALAKLAKRDYHYDPAQYYTRSLDNMPALPAPEPFFAGGLWNKGVAFASVAALVAGATVGFALTKKEEIGTTATRTLAYVGAMLPADQPPQTVVADASSTTSDTTIAKKPIATASLDVSDVSGQLNSAILLPLRADPASADQQLSIRLSGLPEDAVLTPGRKIADQTWEINDEDLATARLIVPHAETPVFDISVAAIETTSGELAAPVREMKLAITNIEAPAAQVIAAGQPAAVANQSVVSQAESAEASTSAPVEPANLKILPANAAPERQGAAVETTSDTVAAASPIPPATAPTAVVPQPSPVALGLLQKGDVLFKAGDLMMARQFYLRAHDLGAAEGALGVARTYDPAVFKELKVEGLMPDAAQAREWYRKASLTGLPEAVNALARFETTAALP